MKTTLHYVVYGFAILFVSFSLPQCAHDEVSPSAMTGDDTGNMTHIGQDYACGDGFCHPSEDSNSCEIDCAYCGDRVCNLMESEETCPRDCSDLPVEDDQDMSMGGVDSPPSDPPPPNCGNSVCDPQEDSQRCPQDCGEIEDMMILPPGPAPDPNEQVIGHIDSLELRNGQWTVSGWACHIGWSPSVEINIYAGGDHQNGVLIKREVAAEDQESAVGDACGVAEGDHRFNVSFTEEELDNYAGETVHIHAVSPVGNEDNALINSGRYSLPGQGSGGQGPGGQVPEGMLPVSLDQVTWLHTDVSNWPVTSELNVNFQGGQICLNYDKTNVWPSVSIPHSSGNGTVDVVANPWVILNYNGQWYAGTWEWLAVGTTCRNKTAVAGDHIKRYAHIPMEWRPIPGQTLYFMVSSLARSSSTTNVQERTNIVEVIWQ